MLSIRHMREIRIDEACTKINKFSILNLVGLPPKIRIVFYKFVKNSLFEFSWLLED